MSYTKIDIGIATLKLLKHCKLSDLQFIAFRTDVKKFLTNLVSKLSQKSPIILKLMQKLVCLNPSLIGSPTVAASNFRDLLLILSDVRRLKLSDLDNNYKLFQNFLDSLEGQPLEQKFELFNSAIERVDFLYNNLRPFDSTLWEIIKAVLILSHGQATVERGFSFNKEIITENMMDKTVIAKHRILDYIKANGGVVNIAITKPLLTAAVAGQQNYNHNLEQEKEKIKENWTSLKQKN